MVAGSPARCSKYGPPWRRESRTQCSISATVMFTLYLSLNLRAAEASGISLYSKSYLRMPFSCLLSQAFGRRHGGTGAPAMGAASFDHDPKAYGRSVIKSVCACVLCANICHVMSCHVSTKSELNQNDMTMSCHVMPCKHIA